MAHKYEHVSTGAGFSVKNGTVKTEIISQAGVVNAAALDQSTVQYKEVSLTAAQLNGMYAASVEIVPAVAGKAIVLDSFMLDLTGTATQFAGGGVVNLQYANTVNGAGTTLHADIAATVLTGATARVLTLRIPKDLSAIATTAINGIGVFIGNKSAAFTTGTGTAVCKVSYHVI